MTVYREFQRSAGEFAPRPFLHIPRQAAAAYRREAVDYTYAEAMAQVQALHRVYQAAGYGCGQRVALVLDNRAEFFFHFLALNALGVSAVPVNAGFTAEEQRYLLEHSDALLCVTLPEHLPALETAMAGLPQPPPLVSSAAFHPPPAREPAAAREPAGPTETALVYTSGTTGKPKGCMLSNAYFLAMGRWYNTIDHLCSLAPGQERLITPLPLVHMNALACSTMGMIMSGGCIVQLDRFHASTWWDTVRESGSSILHYLGVMPAILLNLPESPADDLSGQIKFGFGAGVDPRHQALFEGRFGFPLIEGWAMTETGAGACISAHREPRHVGTRCFGRPGDELACRVVDDDGRDVTPGVPGELLVRAAGPDPRKHFFSGYYKDAAATEAAWEGGWFHTGDVVRVGEDGSYHFVDRKKNVIRRSGENIAAVEVEGVLLQCPEVANCAVTPVPDEIRGEEVAACIVLNGGVEGGPETAASLQRFCLDQLTYYKVPGYIAFVDALPMTPSQKVQRGEVKALCRGLVEHGHCIDLRHHKRRKQR